MGEIGVIQGNEVFHSVIKTFFLLNGGKNPNNLMCEDINKFYFINQYNEIESLEVVNFNSDIHSLIRIQDVIDYVQARTISNTVQKNKLSDKQVYIDYFDDILKEMSDVHRRKNADYGNNFHKRYEKYGFLTALLRLTDKMERLENIYKKGEIQVKDESVEDTLLDLANYAVMTIVELKNGKNNN